MDFESFSISLDVATAVSVLAAALSFFITQKRETKKETQRQRRLIKLNKTLEFMDELGQFQAELQEVMFEIHYGKAVHKDENEIVLNAKKSLFRILNNMFNFLSYRGGNFASLFATRQIKDEIESLIAYCEEWPQKSNDPEHINPGALIKKIERVNDLLIQKIQEEYDFS